MVSRLNVCYQILKIRRCQIVEYLISDDCCLALNTSSNGQPVKLSEDWTNAVASGSSRVNSCRTVLNSLQSVKLILRQANKQHIAIVQAGWDKCLKCRLYSIITKMLPDSFHLSKMVETWSDYVIDVVCAIEMLIKIHLQATCRLHGLNHSSRRFNIRKNNVLSASSVYPQVFSLCRVKSKVVPCHIFPIQNEREHTRRIKTCRGCSRSLLLRSWRKLPILYYRSHAIAYYNNPHIN